MASKFTFKAKKVELTNEQAEDIENQVLAEVKKRWGNGTTGDDIAHYYWSITVEVVMR